MNTFNQIVEQNQKTGKKTFILKTDQNKVQQADLKKLAAVFQKNSFSGICLKCTGSLKKCMELAAVLSADKRVAVIIETIFHKILKYGIAEFTADAAEIGISGIRVPDLPFEEQGQLAVYLLKEDAPFIVREITPSSGDRIPQNMQFARGFILCSQEGNVDFLSQLQGDPYMFYLYAVEAAATLPVILDFKGKTKEELELYLELADGAVIEAEIEDLL